MGWRVGGCDCTRGAAILERSGTPTHGSEGKIMVRYFYAWIPYVAVGTVVFLALPWLGLIALLVVALVALPALAIALVVAPYLLVQTAVGHLRGASVQPSAVPGPESLSTTFQPTYGMNLE